MSYHAGIKEMQQMLTDAGFSVGTVDGWYGPKTRDALEKALSGTGVKAPPAQPAPTVVVGKYKLSQTSLNRLAPLHPDLVKVVKRAIQLSEVDFTVGEGMRTMARQRELVKQGASTTLNSRHLTGHAVDLIALDANGKVSWDWPLYYKIADAMKQAAKDVGVPIEWGGDWRTFKDGPHYQLPWSKYPKK